MYFPLLSKQTYNSKLMGAQQIRENVIPQLEIEGSSSESIMNE